jgi:hypothetical protein
VRQGVKKLIDGVQQHLRRHRFHPIAEHDIACLFYTCHTGRVHGRLKDKQDHIPSDLVVDHWTSGVESSLPLHFLTLQAMWTPF